MEELFRAVLYIGSVFTAYQFGNLQGYNEGVEDGEEYARIISGIDKEDE